jgi:CRISPR/Cas system-associated exonuclease Cas4 (RecB family)
MAQIYCETKEEIETIGAALNFPESHIKRLVKIQENIKKIGRKSWKLEWEFNYDLGDGRIVKGFVDRIIKKKNKYIILDLKTTKAGFWRKNTANITQDLQLRIYAMVVSKTFHIPPANISCYLYYLDDGEPVGAKFSIKTLNETKQYLIDMYKQIEDMPADKAWGNVAECCERCSYKGICPTYKMS